MLPNDFTKHLENLNLSPKTVRNYRSDISHFTAWATLRLRSLRLRSGQALQNETDENLINHLSPDLIEEYKTFQIVNKIPTKTINRRLSTLRAFSKFLQEQNLLNFNPMENITNVVSFDFHYEQKALLSGFKKHLESEGMTNKTMWNYLSDVRGFMAFVERQING